MIHDRLTIHVGDCAEIMRAMPDESVHCIVTSPPYFGLRDYGVAGQIGLEPTPAEFIAAMVEVFREARRVLRSDGTCWVNFGDSYCTGTSAARNPTTIQGDQVPSSWAGRSQPVRIGTPQGMKTKDLMMMPARVAIALCDDGWYLRKDIIWHKPNPMPESVTDRPTSAHEHVFLLTKSERYWYDADAIREKESVPSWDDGSRVFGGKNKHGANIVNGDRTTGRLATSRKRGVPPRHEGLASSDQSGLDMVGRGEGRNARDVWTIATAPFSDAHFATFPPELPRRCILAGCPKGGIVLDPFGGAGTTGLVALRHNRRAILVELNPDYARMAQRRIEREWRIATPTQGADHGPLFSEPMG